MFLLTFNPSNFALVAKDYLHDMNICNNQLQASQTNSDAPNENAETEGENNLVVDMSDVSVDDPFRRRVKPLLVDLEDSVNEGYELNLHDSDSYERYSRRNERESDIEMSSLI